MSEQEQHNPFENHINSDAFDVERLDEILPQLDMSLDIEQFFDELPYPLNHELWDTELDEQQKVICAHLTTELLERVLRVYHDDLLEDLKDEQLIYILTAPITIAMLAQQRLYKTKAEKVKPKILVPLPLQKQSPNRASILLDQVFLWLSQAREFVFRIFRRG